MNVRDMTVRTPSYTRRTSNVIWRHIGRRPNTSAAVTTTRRAKTISCGMLGVAIDPQHSIDLSVVAITSKLTGRASMIIWQDAPRNAVVDPEDSSVRP
jgi:hypothetical protein